MATLADVLLAETDEGTPVVSRLVRQRPDQRLAPDAGAKIKAFGAGVADPASLPSAVVGLVAPEVRDAWRDVKAAHPGMAFAGGLTTGLPLAGAAAALTPTTLGKMLASGVVGVGSDVVDETTGRAALGPATVAKALASQIGVAPMRAFLPAAGVGAVSQMAFVPPAHGQGTAVAPVAPLTEAERGRQAELRAKRSLLAREREELSTLNRREADAAEAVEAERRRIAEETRQRELSAQDEVAAERKARVEKAQNRYDEVLGGFPRAVRETKWKIGDVVPVIGGTTLDVGQTLANLAPFLPIVAGAVTGAKIGKTPDAAKLKAWDDAIATMAAPSASAGQRAAADATAKAMASEFGNRSMPAAGSLAARTGAATGAGAVEGAVLANMPELVDITRLDKNPQRVALEEKLKLLPVDSPEYEQTRRLLADTQAVPDTHPDKLRAQKHFRGGDWIERTLLEGLAGAVAAGTTAAGRMSAPYISTPPAVLQARETGVRAAMDPKAVAAQATAMDDIAAIEAGRRVAAARTDANTSAGVDYFGGETYRQGVRKDLEASAAAAAERTRRAAAAQGRSAGQAPDPTSLGQTGQGAAGARPSGPAQPMQGEGQPPTAVVPSNQVPASPSPSAGGQNSPPGGRQNQGAVLSIDPELRNDIGALIKAVMDAKAPAATPGRALPLPPGRGSWADNIQSTARDVLRARADAGGSLAKGNAAQIGRDIDAALPPAVKRPSESDVRTRVNNLRDVAGDKPTRAELDDVFKAAPDSIYKGKKIPAVAAAGVGAGLAALSPDVQAAITDKVMQSYMAGRGLDRITARDVIGNTGADPVAVTEYLRTLQDAVGGLPTRGDQVRAIREIRNARSAAQDDTSPTGYRWANGQFAEAAR